MDMPRNEVRPVDLEMFATPKHLEHASEQARQRNYQDFLIVDVDSHHYENEHYDEVFDYIESPVIRREGGKWIAVGMLNAPLAALEQSWLRTKATSFAAFMKVAERKANSSNNTLLAASDGTIAYLHPQFVPIRDRRFDYTKPVDGSDPATAWKGLHKLADLPMTVRPKSGWAMNTNNAPWGAAGADSPKAARFPGYMDQFGENPRGIHATMLLSETQRFTPMQLRDLAFDPFLPFFDQQIPMLERGFAAAYAKKMGPLLADNLHATLDGKPLEYAVAVFHKISDDGKAGPGGDGLSDDQGAVLETPAVDPADGLEQGGEYHPHVIVPDDGHPAARAAQKRRTR